MNLTQERQLFLNAAMYCIRSIPWYSQGNISFMGHYRDELVPGDGEVTVMWSRGSTFKHRPCVVRCFDNAHATRTILEEFGPKTVVFDSGQAYFLYEDGYDVMAGTGAAAAIREQQENPVLRDGS